MHYTPKGVPTEDLTRLGLHLAAAPPERVAHTRMLRNFDVALPPGAADVRLDFLDYADDVVGRGAYTLRGEIGVDGYEPLASAARARFATK